jgi:hypothetical protein
MLAFIIWLPFEDTQIWSALALGAGAAVWFGANWFAAPHHRPLSRTIGRGGLTNAIIGAVCGAMAPLLAIALMAVKSGLHAHGFSDFSARQVLIAAALVPVSSVAGALIGWVVIKKKSNFDDEL